MRIMLFQAPTQVTSPHAHLSPPLGLAYIGRHLLDEGHDVELIDMNTTGFNPARVRVALRRYDPDLVGISSHTETYPNAVRIARLVKEHSAATPVVVGGPHASILPFEVLAERDVDFVAVGEGERTAVELAAALHEVPRGEAFGSIAGLGYKVEGEAVLNPAREPLDAAEIGLPARELLALDLYEDAHNILVARGGCPYRCPFCSASHLWGGRRRMRPVPDIIDELKTVIDEYGATRVFFVDDILTLDRAWLFELLEAVEPFAGSLTWGCATRVDRVDAEMLARMAKAGCRGIQFGIESGAQEILDSVKGIEKGTARQAVRWAVESGISVSCSFMIPFPEDTESTIAETAEFMSELHELGGRLLVSYTTPFPGTMFRERADELGLHILTDDWSQYDAKHVVLETRHLAASRIEELAGGIAESLGMSRTA